MSSIILFIYFATMSYNSAICKIRTVLFLVVSCKGCQPVC